MFVEMIMFAVLMYLYLHIIYIAFNKTTRYTKKYFNDFFIIVLPGWLLVFLSSSLILTFANDFVGAFIIKMVFTFSLLVTFSCTFFIFILQPIHKKSYRFVLDKVQEFYKV